jgi:hypothetical protein
MPGVDLVEGLLATRTDVDRACELLESPSPETLDRCSIVLEKAGCQLAEWQPQIRSGGGEPAALAEAGRLRASVRRAGRLLEAALNFHLNWSRLRDALCGGYTRSGEPAAVPRGNRISYRA